MGRLRIYISLFFATFLNFVYSQSVNVTTGGSISGDGGSVSFTIGQTFYLVASGTEGSFIQGVQQPFEISTLTDIDETKAINLTCLVFPNPVQDYIQIKINSTLLQKGEYLKYQLFDLNGKLLVSEISQSEISQIKIGNYAASIYVLNILNNDRLIKSFKITKK